MRTELLNARTAAAPWRSRSTHRAVVALFVVFAMLVPSLPASAKPKDDDARASLSVQTVADQIGADSLWARGITGAGVDVAVIDTGVTRVPGLDGNKVLTGPDLSFEAGHPDYHGVDTYGHGTAMASIIAGNGGEDGFRGIAPDARIVSVKVADNTGAVDVSQVIAAIDWVIEHGQRDGLNVRVINLSYVTDSEQPYELDPLAHAVERAWHAGIVVVVAAGNQGDKTHTLGNPASNPFVIAVAAADGTKTAGYSNRGSNSRTPDVLAPGSNILGLAAPHSRLVQDHPIAFVDGRYLRGSGTSQATAVVAGSVALLLQQRPDLTPDEVKALLLLGTVDDKGDGQAEALKPLEETSKYLDLMDEVEAHLDDAQAHRDAAAVYEAEGDEKKAEKERKDAEKDEDKAEKELKDLEKQAPDHVVYEAKREAHLAEAAELRAEAEALRAEAEALRAAADASEDEKDADKLLKDADKAEDKAEKAEKDADKAERDAAKDAEKADKAFDEFLRDAQKLFERWDGRSLDTWKFDDRSGAGMVDIVRSASLPTLPVVQAHQTSTGTGTLEDARGSNHVVFADGASLAGEVTFTGDPWSGNSWSGNSWSGNSWSGNSWSGNSWTGNSWSGNSWTGNSWTGNSWTGNSWTGNSWTGTAWSGAMWGG